MPSLGVDADESKVHLFVVFVERYWCSKLGEGVDVVKKKSGENGATKIVYVWPISFVMWLFDSLVSPCCVGVRLFNGHATKFTVK